MKKLLFTFFAAMLAIAASAQTFDESLLYGTWTLSEKTGANDVTPLYHSIDEITFSDDIVYYTHYSDGEESEDEYVGGVIKFVRSEKYQKYDHEDSYEGFDPEPYYEAVHDFSITNGDKLHILLDNDYPLIRLKIITLNESTLVVSNYSGTCTLTFAKSASAKVNTISATKTHSNKTYNLSGQEVAKPTQSGVYIEDGKKVLVK